MFYMPAYFQARLTVSSDIDGGGYGQNIGYGIDSPDIGKMITNLMYNNEFAYFEPYFGQASPDMSQFDKWGHFTQIVWKGTQQVGCATVICDSLGNVDASNSVPFTVCNYSPSGKLRECRFVFWCVNILFRELRRRIRQQRPASSGPSIPPSLIDSGVLHRQ